MLPGGFRAAIFLAVTCLATHVAQAQYVWTDEKGTRQYSDTPPPPSVPVNRILKAPANGSATSSVNAQVPAAQAKPSPGKADPLPVSGTQNTASPTIAEKNAEFNKRKAEREEKEKKAAEAARVEAEKTKHCERAREYRRVLDSGQRVAIMDANGERSYLSDERRSAEAAETARVIADCR